MEIIDEFETFVKQNEISKVIAFSGGSDESKESVENVINESMVYFKGKNIAILTGGTSWGIPKIASDIAKDYGLKTIGIMPERGEKYTKSNLDLKVVIPSKYGQSEFGDESEVFAKLSDAVEIIGGSAGTAIEFYHIMKINDRKLNPKYSEIPKYVAPIGSVAGFSSDIYNLDMYQKYSEVFPSDKLSNGGDAANFILNKLGLN